MNTPDKKDTEQSQESEKFQGAMKKIIGVSKEDLKKREDEWKKTHGKTRRKRTTG